MEMFTATLSEMEGWQVFQQTVKRRNDYEWFPQHVLEHLISTAVAEEIPEENVMVQRLLVQSSFKRPNEVMLDLRINFDTNKTIYVIQHEIH